MPLYRHRAKAALIDQARYNARFLLLLRVHGSRVYKQTWQVLRNVSLPRHAPIRLSIEYVANTRCRTTCTLYVISGI